jgi:hypothetical protein
LLILGSYKFEGNILVLLGKIHNNEHNFFINNSISLNNY